MPNKGETYKTKTEPTLQELFYEIQKDFLTEAKDIIEKEYGPMIENDYSTSNSIFHNLSYGSTSKNGASRLKPGIDEDDQEDIKTKNDLIEWLKDLASTTEVRPNNNSLSDHKNITELIKQAKKRLDIQSNLHEKLGNAFVNIVNKKLGDKYKYIQILVQASLYNSYFSFYLKHLNYFSGRLTNHEETFSYQSKATKWTNDAFKEYYKNFDKTIKDLDNQVNKMNNKNKKNNNGEPYPTDMYELLKAAQGIHVELLKYYKTRVDTNLEEDDCNKYTKLIEKIEQHITEYSNKYKEERQKKTRPKAKETEQEALLSKIGTEFMKSGKNYIADTYGDRDMLQSFITQFYYQNKHWSQNEKENDRLRDSLKKLFLSTLFDKSTFTHIDKKKIEKMTPEQKVNRIIKFLKNKDSLNKRLADDLFNIIDKELKKYGGISDLEKKIIMIDCKRSHNFRSFEKNCKNIDETYENIDTTYEQPYQDYHYNELLSKNLKEYGKDSFKEYFNRLDLTNINFDNEKNSFDADSISLPIKLMQTIKGELETAYRNVQYDGSNEDLKIEDDEIFGPTFQKFDKHLNELIEKQTELITKKNVPQAKSQLDDHNDSKIEIVKKDGLGPHRSKTQVTPVEQNLKNRPKNEGFNNEGFNIGNTREHQNGRCRSCW